MSMLDRLDPRLAAGAIGTVAVVLLGYAFWPRDVTQVVDGRSVPVATTAVSAPIEVAEPAAAEAIRDGAREDQYIALDGGRHPKDILAFYGVGSGMRILEWRGALGYYTELLSRAVGRRGRIYTTGLVNPSMVGRLRNTRVVAEDGHELPDSSVDLVFTHLNYHDFVVQGVDRRALLGAALRVLRPGGLLAIVDHAALDGSGTRDARALHRIDEAFVRAEVAALGFEFVEASDVLRRPNDDRRLFIMDPAIRGKTDRFVLKFRRPQSVAIPRETKRFGETPEPPPVDPEQQAIDAASVNPPDPPPYDIGPGESP